MTPSHYDVTATPQSITNHTTSAASAHCTGHHTAAILGFLTSVNLCDVTCTIQTMSFGRHVGLFRTPSYKWGHNQPSVLLVEPTWSVDNDAV